VLKSDRYYFYSPCGLGDTMILEGYKEALEQKLGSPIFFVIKKSHEVVMEMFEERDYLFEEELREQQFVFKPELGRVFIAHPMYWDEPSIYLESFRDFKLDFLSFYKKFLGLSDSIIFKLPKFTPEISDDLYRKLKVTKLEKIALLCPEANSVPLLDKTYWQQEAEKLKSDGFEVFCNVLNKKNAIRNTKVINLTLREAVALGAHCGKVIALMSGYCYLIMKNSSNIKIVYPNFDAFYLYSMKRTFGDYETREIVVTR
jgi:hypothetical protein